MIRKMLQSLNNSIIKEYQEDKILQKIIVECYVVFCFILLNYVLICMTQEKLTFNLNK